MKRWIERAAILGGLGVLVGFGWMVAMVMAYTHLPRDMYRPFQAAVLVFMGSIVWCFVVWLLGAWYDRVQLRRQQEAWRREAWHGMYRGAVHVLTSWAVKGTITEIMERDAYQARLDCGELSHVEVIDSDPEAKTTTMLRKQP